VLLCGSPPAHALQFDPVKDAIALGISAAFAGAGELVVRFAPPVPVSPEASYAGLGSLDKVLLFGYSKPADVVSTFLETAAMLTPLLMAASAGPTEFLPDVAVYAEAFGMALGAKDLAKYLLPRYRPYTYQGGAAGVEPSEDKQSFPSGHATMSFAAAAFSTYLYVQGLPRTAPLLPFVIANYALAGLTSTYRVVSGMHFPSDVFAGAALGFVCGFVLPTLLRS
jgi:membrane-associated phospholipid phosphatase